MAEADWEQIVSRYQQLWYSNDPIDTHSTQKQIVPFFFLSSSTTALVLD